MNKDKACKKKRHKDKRNKLKVVQRFYTDLVQVRDGENCQFLPTDWSVGWDDFTITFTAFSAFPLIPTKRTAGIFTRTKASISGTPAFVAQCRGVSAPLRGNQTISGNLKGQTRCSEAFAPNNFTLAFAAKVVKPDGTDRGILLAVTAADDTTATPPEFATGTDTNRRILNASESTPIALSSVNALDGDVIVFEWGIRENGGFANDFTLHYGNTSASGDLPEDDTSTSVLNPWVEFDGTALNFYPLPRFVGSTSNPADNGAENEPVTLAVTPPTGMVAGDLVIFYGQLQIATAGQITQSELGGQTWTASFTGTGANDMSAAVWWCEFNGTWTANPSLAFAAQTGTQPATVEMSVFRGDFRGTWVVDQAVSQASFAGPASPFDVTITGQTTTKPSTVTQAAWFTADVNTWGTPAETIPIWNLTNQTQIRNTAGGDQSVAFAYCLLGKAGATGSPTRRQATNGADAGISQIGSWAWSPIRFDAASNSGYQAAASTYSWSHTCTGSNRFLDVSVAILSVGGTVTGITFNGDPLTFVVGKTEGVYRAEKWKLDAPDEGTFTIAVTLSGTLASSAGAISLTGVHQTSSTEAAASASAVNVGAADATVNVTTVADNDWVLDMVATSDTAITVGAGQTQRVNVTGAAGSGAMSHEGPKSPAGSVTASWTSVGAAATWAIVAVAVRPVTVDALLSAVIGHGSLHHISRGIGDVGSGPRLPQTLHVIDQGIAL